MTVKHFCNLCGDEAEGFASIQTTKKSNISGKVGWEWSIDLCVRHFAELDGILFKQFQKTEDQRRAEKVEQRGPWGHSE